MQNNASKIWATYLEQVTCKTDITSIRTVNQRYGTDFNTHITKRYEEKQCDSKRDWLFMLQEQVNLN